MSHSPKKRKFHCVGNVAQEPLDKRCHFMTNILEDSIINSDVVRNIDRTFSHTILPIIGDVDQEITGTCWLISGLNMIRYKTIENLDLPTDFIFSKAHLFFWSKIESINKTLHLACEAKSLSIEKTDMYIKELYHKYRKYHKTIGSDGGYFWTFRDLVEKYGLMPDEVFKCNTTCKDSRFLNRILQKEIIVSLDTIRKHEGDSLTLIPSIMTHYKKIIATVISVPPTTFTFRYRKQGRLVKIGPITPVEFYKNYSNIKLEEYIYVMANKMYSNNEVIRLPSSSKYSSTIIEKPHVDLFNVSLNRMEQLAKKSILFNNAVYFDADINNDMSVRYTLMDRRLYNYNYLNLNGFKLEAEGKNIYYRFAHSMLICGVDIDLRENNTRKTIVKWEVQNSWDEFYTRYVMTRDWFRKYVHGIVVHIDMLTEKEKNSYVKSIKNNKCCVVKDNVGIYYSFHP
jgi:bleomycin hydrolase